MLDEARFFLGKDTVKKVLNWMSLLKFNKFHWGLTNDQGWRIEIDKYPRLIEIGSKRKSTPICRNTNLGSDGVEHAGFYTKKDIKEIIEYAKSLYIDIVPEIEMPGHSTAALAAYPEFSCTGGPFEVASTWGIKKDVFCPGNLDTVPFLKDILKEVADLFPYEYIHTGGDEVPKDRWSQCTKCQEKIKNENLLDEKGLQIHFTNQIVEFLDSLGKKAIVWNEVADKRLDNRTTAQFWRGSFDPIISFLEEGGSTIISPARYYYVNMAYHTISLNEAYQYEPLPIDISKRFKENILGIEAELWGEVIKSEEKAEYCAFPRVLAIAETAWTQPEHKNLKRILKSIKQFEPILEKMNIKYTSLKEANPSGLRTFINRWKKGFGAYL
jgi:hexosaminidase